MNTPSASADGFSDKLCGNPLAWRLKAGSRPEICPQKHDLGGGNVAVEDAATFAVVHPFTESLALDRAALGACLACAAWIDQLQQTTGAFCLVADLLDEAVPSGIVNGLGEHSSRQPFYVQVLHSDVRKAVYERLGPFV